MNSRVWRLSALAAIFVTGATGCDRMATWATTRRAPWTYVREAWGGIVPGSPSVEGSRLRLPFTLDLKSAKRGDSGVCICGVKARNEGSRIVVAFYECVCGPGAIRDFTATMPRPKPGTYSVVYDDHDAGFPALGSVEVAE